MNSASYNKTPEARCVHLYNSGMRGMGVTNYFLLGFEAYSSLKEKKPTKFFVYSVNFKMVEKVPELAFPCYQIGDYVIIKPSPNN